MAIVNGILDMYD